MAGQNPNSTFYTVLSEGAPIQNYIVTDSSILNLPKNDDILVGVEAKQTLSNKTLIEPKLINPKFIGTSSETLEAARLVDPTVSGGTFQIPLVYNPNVTNPYVTGGTYNNPTLNGPYVFEGQVVGGLTASGTASIGDPTNPFIRGWISDVHTDTISPNSRPYVGLGAHMYPAPGTTVDLGSPTAPFDAVWANNFSSPSGSLFLKGTGTLQKSSHDVNIKLPFEYTIFTSNIVIFTLEETDLSLTPIREPLAFNITFSPSSPSIIPNVDQYFTIFGADNTGLGLPVTAYITSASDTNDPSSFKINIVSSIYKILQTTVIYTLT